MLEKEEYVVIPGDDRNLEVSIDELKAKQNSQLMKSS